MPRTPPIRKASRPPARSRPRRGQRPGDGGTPETIVARATAVLPGLLPRQRWFAGKARTITAVTAGDHAAVPDSPGLLALFTVTYADGGAETYLIPVMPDGGEDGIREALADPGFCRALVELIRQEASLTGRHGSFRFTGTGVLAELLPRPPESVSLFEGEQSNTSVILDRRGTLKVFRRLESGLNPDFEIPEFLTRRTAFRGSPRLAGAITYLPAQGEEITLAVLLEFVASQGDAWSVALGRLAEYFVTLVEGLEDGSAGAEAFARALAEADAAEARRLGALTGQLHAALASAGPETALAPEPILPADLLVWGEGMERLLDRALEDLVQTRESLPPTERDLAGEVLDQAPRLRQSLGGLQGLGTGSVTKIRIHGDYHLGQVLKTADGFAILDFEGEPARPLTERRGKQCALKDVAGMLRSFAYAARAGLRAAVKGAPDDAALARQLAPWAERWLEAVRAGFLEGYLAETWEREVPFLPREREPLEAVLRVFELDRAVYELHYELHHRPAWVRLPLEGLRAAQVPAPAMKPGRLHPEAGPFSFVACLELHEFLGLRAENERQLADLIDEVSLDSIYYHTHAFLLRHKFVAGTYPNDFATWAAVEVRDRVLGERLALVDPAAFSNLQALREELASVIDDHLRGLTVVPGIILGEPFEFIQSRMVEIPTGITVRSLEELRAALLDVDVSAIYFHLVEARLRLGRGQNDFAAWLEQGLGLPELAAKVRAVDPYTGSVERARTRLIHLCDEALAAGAGR